MSRTILEPGVPAISSVLGWTHDRLMKGLLTAQEEDYTAYQGDPVGFGRKFLKDRYTAEVKRMMETFIGNRVVIAQSANGVGKSHAAADIAVWAYKVFPQVQVYTLAAPPENNLKRNIWGKLGRIYNQHPELFKDSNVSIPGMRIERKGDPESFIEGQAIPVSGDPAVLVSKFSGKHAPVIVFIVDEGDGVADEVYDGIETCMSGGRAHLLIPFNPKIESGPVYQKQRNKGGVTVKLTAFNHPNVREGKDLIPGAVTREVTVWRINEWTRPLTNGETPDGDCFNVPDFLVGCVADDLEGGKYPPLKPGWRRVTDGRFSYMVLAEYPAIGEDQLISREWVVKAISRWKLYVAEYGENTSGLTNPIMGQDCADLGQDKNVSFLRFGNFVARPEIWGGVDPLVTGERAAKIYKLNRAMYANVDSTGVGASVAPSMVREGCHAHRIMVQSTPDEEQLTEKEKEEGVFYSTRDIMLWRLAQWLKHDKGAMIPDDKELYEELITPTYEKMRVGGKIKVMDSEKMKQKLGRSPDKLMALALTFAPIPGYKGGEVTVKKYA